MSTLAIGAPVPDGLACRLAAYYGEGINSPLSVLYWTGRVLPGTAYRINDVINHCTYPKVPACGRSRQRDEHAVVAELRALSHYCKVNEGRGEVEDWLKQRHKIWLSDYHELVVPWGWKPPE